MDKDKKMVTPDIILLAEDDEAQAILITRALEEAGAANKIYLVRDGEEALDYLFRRGNYADKGKSPRPGLVLLDLRLPKLDGLDVLNTIKQSEELKSIPVVVITTSDNNEDIAQAYRNHANSYLVKPLGFGEFSGMIRELSTYWLAVNRHPIRGVI